MIVVGASAGGVEALKCFASGLPENLRASVFVVLHTLRSSGRPSVLPHILSRAGHLLAAHALHGEKIRYGRIYVAPPDYNLQLAAQRIRLMQGPNDGPFRPAIDALFCSAAAAYGERVTGVILTGSLDDGVAGLAEIKRRGGVAVIQDPATALFPSMPASALASVDVDFVAPLPEIASIVASLARNGP